MTSAELLELFNDMTGRSATDAITPAKKYTWLARAEQEVIAEIARVKPSSLYPKVGTSSMPTLSTTDDNVFTFGAGVHPFGTVQIFSKLTDIPDRPWRPGYDYLEEGDQIRLPRNRTYSGTLYYRGIVMPAAISASEAPHLIPGAMNELTAIRATQRFAAGGNMRNAALMNEMKNQWKDRFPVWCVVLKRQFDKGGALMTWSLKDVVTPLL